jgi:ligand-binding sensor protein
MSLSQEHQEFFSLIREKLIEIQNIADDFGYSDEFAYFTVAGIYTNNDDGTQNLKVMSDFYIGDEDELDNLISVGIQVYQDTVRNSERADDLDDFLNDLGITTSEDE